MMISPPGASWPIWRGIQADASPYSRWLSRKGNAAEVKALVRTEWATLGPLLTGHTWRREVRLADSTDRRHVDRFCICESCQSTSAGRRDCTFPLVGVLSLVFGMTTTLVPVRQDGDWQWWQ